MALSSCFLLLTHLTEDDGFKHTIECTVCFTWHHIQCVAIQGNNFVCRYCAPHIPHHNSGAGPRTQDFSMSGSFTGGTENSSEIHQAGNKNKTVRLDISLSIK